MHGSFLFLYVKVSTPEHLGIHDTDEHQNKPIKCVFCYQKKKEENVMLYRLTYRKIDHNQRKSPPADQQHQINNEGDH